MAVKEPDAFVLYTCPKEETFKNHFVFCLFASIMIDVGFTVFYFFKVKCLFFRCTYFPKFV